MRWVHVVFLLLALCCGANAETTVTYAASDADVVRPSMVSDRTGIVGTRGSLASHMLMVAQVPSGQQSGDDDTAAAIIAAGTAIDEAFANQDKEAIRALLIPGHISVTPYYDGPQSVEGQIDSVSDFSDYTQTTVGEPSVQMLSPDVGIKSFIADLTGSFKGTPLPARVFVSQIMVRRDGKWIGGFYQVTALKP